MNFEFSPDDEAIRAQARSLLASRRPQGRHDAVEATFDRKLWREIAELGWLAAAVPEAAGGVGLGYGALACLTEEIGRSLTPLPFTSAILAIELMLALPRTATLDRLLPQALAGERIGCVHVALDRSDEARPRFRDGVLSGCCRMVLDGADGDVLFLLADAGHDLVWLAVDLSAPGVVRSPAADIEPERGHASVAFAAVSGAEVLTRANADDGEFWATLQRLAILMAWEQVGAAQGALDQACAYAKERTAFGRPIGSYQAVKHRLVDVYTSVELARSHACAGLCALTDEAEDLAARAAAARLSATGAQSQAARDNLLTHGGVGFTWSSDCHRFVRRADALGVALGGREPWASRLAQRLAVSVDEGANHGPA